MKFDLSQMNRFGYRDLGNRNWKPILVSLLTLALLTVPFVFAMAQGATPVKASVKPQLFTLFFITRFSIDIIAIIVLVRYVYFPIHKKKDFYFSFFTLNILVFILTYLLSKTAFAAVSAVGLLAAFSILRLRTETISIKDMTYLFVVLTVGVINATMSGPYYELITMNVAIVLLVFGLDREWISKSIHVREIELDSLENIMPQNMDKLVADMRARTGLDVQRIKVESVDVGRNRARISLFYY